MLRAFTTADILSLTASSCLHHRAIHDRGIDEGLNHEQSDLVGRLLHDSSGLQYP
jgi:hypothetical protein